LAQAGQIEEAQAALVQLKKLHSEISIAWIAQNVPYTPSQMPQFLEGMRKAGLE
jgi:DNA-binding IscR family transcriptional regulator